MPTPAAVIDSEFLHEEPLDALMLGRASGLRAVIIGMARDEVALGSLGGARVRTREDVVLRTMWELAGVGSLAAAALDGWDNGALQQIAEDIVKMFEVELTDTGAEHLPSVQKLWDTVASSLGCGCTVQCVVDRLAGVVPVYRYRFDGFGGSMGFHGWELDLVHGGVSDNGCCGKVQQQWMQSWANFAYYGDPNISEMKGAWRPHVPNTDGGSCVMTWDGVKGWAPIELSCSGALGRLTCLWEDLTGLQRRPKPNTQDGLEWSSATGAQGPPTCVQCGHVRLARRGKTEVLKLSKVGPSFTPSMVRCLGASWRCTACWVVAYETIGKPVAPWECHHCGCLANNGTDEDGTWLCSDCRHQEGGANNDGNDPSPDPNPDTDCSNWEPNPDSDAHEGGNDPDPHPDPHTDPHVHCGVRGAVLLNGRSSNDIMVESLCSSCGNKCRDGAEHGDEWFCVRCWRGWMREQQGSDDPEPHQDPHAADAMSWLGSAEGFALDDSTSIDDDQKHSECALCQGREPVGHTYDGQWFCSSCWQSWDESKGIWEGEDDGYSDGEYWEEGEEELDGLEEEGEDEQKVLDNPVRQEDHSSSAISPWLATDGMLNVAAGDDVIGTWEEIE
eukprot:gnl/MRDRNA2_/MRDRNA2_72923_c0_seq1.p1 gnl/MRDRNA2_/MRDRNA2_72923_c0~~gnl/MRDRNA2_/MRDRNA2_72923_c0_seq1.p1  ORF type:complete len:646 (+),score=109.77 gnl/MRDRNA2_/MRDRNA2_72923_c0_seq1:96-1940(+)